MSRQGLVATLIATVLAGAGVGLLAYAVSDAALLAVQLGAQTTALLNLTVCVWLLGRRP